MIKKELKVTLIQTPIVSEASEQNLKQLSKVVSTCHDSDLILLPEMFNTGFAVDNMAVAEPPDGRAATWLKEIAIQKQCAISGTILTKIDSSFVNRLYLFTADGACQFYDKQHLFSLGGEHLYIASGQERKIFKLHGWNILPQICYDLRFPVFARNRFTLEKFDYDIALYLANWPASRSEIWRTLLRARSIENQAYIIGVNRTGEDKTGLKHDGNSLIAHPDASLLLDLGTVSESHKSYILNYDSLQNYRKKFAFAQDWDHFKLKS